MSTFKQRLRKLLSNSFICNDEESSNNADKSFHETINLTKKYLRKNLKKNNSTLNLYNNYINNNNNNNIIILNPSRQFYPSLFTIKNLKKEKIGKINTLMRSISLKDIHNHIENNNLNLSRSYSSLDLSFNNDNNNFKKKLENLKKNFGLDNTNNNKLNINRPIRNLKLQLYNININDIINMSPRVNRIQKFNQLKKNNFRNSNIKKIKYKYINYPKSHKFNSQFNNNNNDINKFNL